MRHINVEKCQLCVNLQHSSYSRTLQQTAELRKIEENFFLVFYEPILTKKNLSVI